MYLPVFHRYFYFPIKNTYQNRRHQDRQEHNYDLLRSQFKTRDTPKIADDYPLDNIDNG